MIAPVASADAERELLARAVGGRFRVMDLVARGGMASVYRGFEHGLERHVAIKLLAPSRASDADERGRFRREARILAALQHPGIVSALSIGESGGPCWFAMPLLTGGTLAQRLLGRRLDPEEARQILIALADALAHAHQRGVVHRDLKAENVLIDGVGRPVIVDFGVAILSTSEHSRAEVSKGYGTPEYMAPEQFLGTIECDGRQDLYALGVLGYRMLTGRFPFEGSIEQIRAAHVTRAVPPVEAYNADVPKELARAINKCLEKRPAARWKDAAAFSGALRGAGSAGGRWPRGARWILRRLSGSRPQVL